MANTCHYLSCGEQKNFGKGLISGCESQRNVCKSNLWVLIAAANQLKVYLKNKNKYFQIKYLVCNEDINNTSYSAENRKLIYELRKRL